MQQTTEVQQQYVEQRTDSVGTSATCAESLERLRLRDLDTTEVRIEQLDSQTTLVRILRHRHQTLQTTARHTAVRHDTATQTGRAESRLTTRQRQTQTERHPRRSGTWILCLCIAAVLTAGLTAGLYLKKK